MSKLSIHLITRLINILYCLPRREHLSAPLLSAKRFRIIFTLVINKTGNAKKSTNDQLNNDQMFTGSENNFVLERVLTRNFICEFQLRDYPFDKQVCDMVFVMQVCL